MFGFLSKKPSSFFGIDLGTTGVKVVHLAYENNKVVLKNYVSLEAESKVNPDGTVVKRNIQALDENTVESMRAVIESAGIANHKVAMSIPSSSTFSSIITLPKMSDDEIENAVNYEARQYIPVPIEEVVYGWSKVTFQESPSSKDKDKKQQIDDDGTEKMRILLIAIPKETSAKYLKIANSFNLDLVALETESFSLARSLVGKRDGVFVIIDIGYKMTGLTIIDKGAVVESHSVSSVGGEELTKVISHSFGVNEQRANVLKKEVGLNSTTDKRLAEIVVPILGIIVSEIKKNEEIYVRNNKKKIDGVILTGGSSLMPGLQEFFADELRVPVELGDPFKMVSYNPILSEKLKLIAPYYAVAMGLALRGFSEE